jgi:hypothetical protein
VLDGSVDGCVGGCVDDGIVTVDIDGGKGVETVVDIVVVVVVLVAPIVLEPTASVGVDVPTDEITGDGVLVAIVDAPVVLAGVADDDMVDIV